MRPLGWALIHYDWCPYEKRKLGQRHTEERPCEGTERRQPSRNQGERPQKKPTLPIP